MTTLQAEQRRLFLVDDANNPSQRGYAAPLITADGRTRAMVLELARPADWQVMSAVWQGVQADLNLPAPAIAVSGVDGYQLWFSLAEPVWVAQAHAFLESLRVRYLGAIATSRVGLMPSTSHHANLVPAQHHGTGLWSAFVAPDLAPIFSDSPWLDVCPSAEAQANVLARMKSIKPDAFQALLGHISPAVESVLEGPGGLTVAAPAPAPAPASQGKGLSPKHFLQGVMNDPAMAMNLRIEAAKALLPYV